MEEFPKLRVITNYCCNLCGFRSQEIWERNWDGEWDYVTQDHNIGLMPQCCGIEMEEIEEITV